jgi:hypothetical protein
MLRKIFYARSENPRSKVGESNLRGTGSNIYWVSTLEGKAVSQRLHETACRLQKDILLIFYKDETVNLENENACLQLSPPPPAHLYKAENIPSVDFLEI